MKMLIKEFAVFTGVSVRTLHYYDDIGLLKPAFVDDATGYRYYDENSLLRMQAILFYRELDFSLKNIRKILSSTDFDRRATLEEQKKLLILKKERLERLISSIDEAMKGANVMSAFDNSEFEKYKSEVQKRWGSTDAYKEYSEKAEDYSDEKQKNLSEETDRIMAEFAHCLKNGKTPDSDDAQCLVKKLQGFISDNYYLCTNEILSGLGQMYVADERFRKNIDKHAEGTAAFICKAIEIYCLRS